MKILFDNQIFRAQQYGGISRYFYEVAKYLSAEKNCDVEIFAPLHINQYLTSTSGIHVLGRKIKRPPYSGYITRCINSALTRLLVTPRNDIDIFHETYFAMADNCPRSARRVITVYDMIHEKFAHQFSNRDTTRKFKVHAVHRADHVICISENTRQDLVNLLGVPEKKTSVVYLGYTLSCPIGSIKPAIHRKPFILYVGSRNGYKNFDMLLRAFASSELLRNEFSIICFGGGKALKRELDLTEKLDLPADCVTYLGGNDSVLAGLYKSAKAFVYPSLYEGFGIPPLEAMSFGCPVVCANASSIPEVVGDAAHLFDPKSESDLRGAMEKVLFSSEYSARLTAKGYERIKLFSWEKCADDTLNVYKKVLGKN